MEACLDTAVAVAYLPGKTAAGALLTV